MKDVMEPQDSTYYHHVPEGEAEDVRFSKHDLLALHDEVCQRAKELMVPKNDDYAGPGGGQPFANFERSAAMGLGSREEGLLVRVTDKLSRLVTYCQSGKLAVEGETWVDACLDSINYQVILMGMIMERLNLREIPPPK